MQRTKFMLTLTALLACGAAGTAVAHPGGGMAGGRPMQGGPMMGGPGAGGGMPGGGMMGGPGGGQMQRPHGPGGGPALRAAGLVLRAADSDDSHDVTADEWAALLAAVDADGDGVVDLDALIALLPAPGHEPPAGAPALADVLAHDLDVDRDGTVTTADLQAIFDRLDTDGSGGVSQDDAPDHARPPADPRRAACLLARAADTDGDHATSADEWAALYAAVDADGDGIVDLGALIALLPAPPHEPPAGAPAIEDVLAHELDLDGDGAVEIEDLEAIVGFLDRNDDGVVAKRELKAPKPKGKMLGAALALARAADADDSHDVSADEWGAFTSSLVLNDDGTVSLDDFASKVRGPKRGWPDDAAVRDAMILAGFDRDGDGTLTVADLAAVFGELDRNGDGALSRAELRPRR